MHDAGTGLRYHRARYFDAAIDRWTQQDPIGFAAGDANLYRYVGNRPTGNIDPTGLYADDDGWGLPWWNPWNLPPFSFLPWIAAGDIHWRNYQDEAKITDQIKERDVALGVDSRAEADEARRIARDQAQRPIGRSTADLIIGAETAVAGSYGDGFGVASPKPGLPRLPARGTPERKAIEAARSRGIAGARQRELSSIRTGGRGSGVWTDTELEQIRTTGKFPEDVRWHHDPTVANRPDLAGDPAVVRPVRGGEAGHLEAHGGDYRKPYPE
jgi:RHS repeat-associated protein